MSLIIPTGTNLGDKLQNLKNAKAHLTNNFIFLAESKIYQSKAEDVLDQPEFYNQVLEFEVPNVPFDEIMKTLLKIEDQMGRVRIQNKGPRIIDLDVLFIGTEQYKSAILEVPHPRVFERSFTVKPLKELPFHQTLEKIYQFPNNFKNDATPIDKI